MPNHHHQNPSDFVGFADVVSVLVGKWGVPINGCLPRYEKVGCVPAFSCLSILNICIFVHIVNVWILNSTPKNQPLTRLTTKV